MFVLAFAEGGVQILPDFSMVVHIVIILVMIWILNRTLFRPINKIIAARSTGKGGQFAETDSMLKAADEKETEYKAALLSTREEGYKIIERERGEAVAIRQEKVAGAKKEIAAKRQSDLDELSKQTEAARKVIAEEAVNLADEISKNVLKTA
jgi:F-type H+-transporting ATPase subunit b